MSDVATIEPKLTAKRVEELFVDCLFREGEPTDNAVAVKGIVTNVGFHPERVEGHKAEIRELLHELSDDFVEGKGGGMSFLNASFDKHAQHWGEHRNMEQLFLLGIAAGEAKSLMPRTLWHTLPGGMPYYSVSK